MNVLLVDDDVDSRQSLAVFLKKLGHSVFEADNGREALDELRKTFVHLVLSDIRMPVMDGFELLKEIKKTESLKQCIVVLFTGYGEVRGAVEAMRFGAYDYLLKPINVEELAVLMDRISEYLALKEENLRLSEHFERQVEYATKDIQKQLNEIQKAYAREVGVSEIGIFSKSMKMVFKTAEQLHKRRDIPVLIEGETGTGKEIVARYIHYGNGETTTPFVGINCAAISPQLFESELFGYEAGAFTGGVPKGQKGKIELARGGTLFLDEITELTPEYQAKLLRAIEEREYFKVGGIKKQKVDVRFICTTNQDITGKISEGAFRQDLYYRLNVGYIRIPPLRERREEILPMAKIFLGEAAQEYNSRFSNISSEAAKVLHEYGWPGNLRELKNTIKRILLLWDEYEIKPHHLDFLFQKDVQALSQKTSGRHYSIDDFPLPDGSLNLKEWNENIIKKALEKYKGNKTDTARYLGISRSALYTYLKKIENGT